MQSWVSEFSIFTAMDNSGHSAILSSPSMLMLNLPPSRVVVFFVSLLCISLSLEIERERETMPPKLSGFCGFFLLGESLLSRIESPVGWGNSMYLVVRTGGGGVLTSF